MPNANQKRRNKAFSTLLAHTTSPTSSEEAFIDLITDLLHLADEYGMDLEAIIRMAKANHAAETSTP